MKTILELYNSLLFSFKNKTVSIIADSVCLAGVLSACERKSLLFRGKKPQQPQTTTTTFLLFVPKAAISFPILYFFRVIQIQILTGSPLYGGATLV